MSNASQKLICAPRPQPMEKYDYGRTQYKRPVIPERSRLAGRFFSTISRLERSMVQVLTPLLNGVLNAPLTVP